MNDKQQTIKKDMPEQQDRPVQPIVAESTLGKKHLTPKRIIVIAALVIVVGAVSLYAYVSIVLGGGLDQMRLSRKPAPNPNSEAVKTERAAGKKIVEDNFNLLESASKFTTLATSQEDACYSGQHTYEVHNSYSHRCMLKETRFYGFSGNFRSTLVNFERTLLANKWDESGNFAITEMLKDYYDVYMFSTSSSTLSASGGQYKVSDLPGTSASKDANPGKLELSTSFAQNDTTDLDLLDHSQHSSADIIGRFYNTNTYVDVKTLFPSFVKSNKFVLAVGIEYIYHED